MKITLEISESFNIARSAIVANKGRGILTTLGIVIGIIAVITTMTAAMATAKGIAAGKMANEEVRSLQEYHGY